MKHAKHFIIQPGWRLLLADMGVNPVQVLRLAGLPGDMFVRKDASVTPLQYFQLWQAIEQIAGVEALPLKVGRAISVEAFDPPIFASLCSPNLNCALQRLAGFKKLIGPMTLDIDIESGRTSATLNCYGGDGVIPQSLRATELVFITQLVRLGTRQRVIPLDIVLPELPSQLQECADYFGIVPRLGPVTQVSFSAQDGVRPFLTENAAMWEFFEAGLRKRLSDLDSEATMRDRAKSVLLEMLPAGQSSIEDAAHRLAMSKRTLQRHLSDESTSFQDVLNATRHELAQHYLVRSTISQGEISFLLGFRDGNSFIRAFKEWSGVTPAAYRHEQAGTGLAQ